MPKQPTKAPKALGRGEKGAAGREALAAVGLLGAVMAAGGSPQWRLNEQQSRPLGPPKAAKEGKRR
jgi:hypothetical protein